MNRYWPRQTDGLPPGQRLLDEMPRFSDKPLRWPPKVPDEPLLQLSLRGEPVADLGVEQLAAMGIVERSHDFHCVTGWSVRDLAWSGVPLIDVFDEHVASADRPPFASVAAADDQRLRFLTEDLLDPTVLIATHLNGEPLTPRHGAPLRLVTPLQYGYKNAKHVIAIDLVDAEPATTVGPKEHLRARVEREERHSKLPNWLLRIPYRLTITPTAWAAQRALDRRPD